MEKREDGAFEMAFLERILEERGMPSSEQWKMLYQCTMDSDSSVRYDAAEALGIRCNDKDEERLHQMTYDSAGLVDIEAIESLAMGHQEKNLRRMYELMRLGGRRVRGYAVSTFFNVWINRYGYKKSSAKKCWRKMEKLYKKEKDVWVLNFYEKARYLCGYKKGIAKLRDILHENQGYAQSMAFSQLKDIRTIFNEKEINGILKTALDYTDNLWGIKKSIDELLETREFPRILLVSKENKGLSQMLEYLSYKMENEIWVRSAGINPAEEIMDEVREKLGEEEKMKRYYYPKEICSVWIYDFIVPLGIRIKPEDYPFQRLVPLFEDADERMLDVVMAEKMLEELRDYIYKEMEQVR